MTLHGCENRYDAGSSTPRRPLLIWVKKEAGKRAETCNVQEQREEKHHESNCIST